MSRRGVFALTAAAAAAITLLSPSVLAFYEAHVEAAEQGNHTIIVDDQAGCVIDRAVTAGRTHSPVNGSVSVPVAVKNHQAGSQTYFVDVYCQ